MVLTQGRRASDEGFDLRVDRESTGAAAQLLGGVHLMVGVDGRNWSGEVSAQQDQHVGVAHARRPRRSPGLFMPTSEGHVLMKCRRAAWPISLSAPARAMNLCSGTLNARAGEDQVTLSALLRSGC